MYRKGLQKLLDNLHAQLNKILFYEPCCFLFFKTMPFSHSTPFGEIRIPDVKWNYFAQNAFLVRLVHDDFVKMTEEKREGDKNEIICEFCLLTKVNKNSLTSCKAKDLSMTSLLS